MKNVTMHATACTYNYASDLIEQRLDKCSTSHSNLHQSRRNKMHEDFSMQSHRCLNDIIYGNAHMHEIETTTFKL